MTFNGIAVFCNDKHFVIDDLKLPLTDFIDFSDVNAKHPVLLKIQTFAKAVEASAIRMEKNKNVDTSLTDAQPENVGKAPKDGISRH